ncbi:MAG TPA: hypothetical protein VKT81_12100 [Bryobacteraceae bacterium]|nr:hypothetical protein [Bryobacteraceae bacterium]
MNGRRWWIVIGMAAVLHNALRAVAAILGAPWGVFNYLSFFEPHPLTQDGIVELVGLGLLVIFTAALSFAGWRKRPTPQPRLSSLLCGAAAGGALGLLAVYVNTLTDRMYGVALFIAVPFLVGFVAVIVRGIDTELTAREAFSTSLLSVLFLGCLLMAFAIEGAVCLAMALPIALPLAICGGMLAYLVKPMAHRPATFLLLVGLTPFGGTLERSFGPPAEVFTVTTSLDIPASPERVWQTVLQPAKLSAPTHALFRAGIAYPLASHIEGIGPGATRYCDFSTGKLVEPVLIWKEGSQLRFTVRSNPLPMQEWTPYAQIHPPHLEGFLASRQGEFRLERLSNGSTRLYATTWYQHHMWPATYWRTWSDYTIHRVHDMVLANVRDRALATGRWNLRGNEPLVR